MARGCLCPSPSFTLQLRDYIRVTGIILPGVWEAWERLLLGSAQGSLLLESSSQGAGVGFGGRVL